MTSREQTLAIVLLGAIALTVGGAGGYMFVWQPLQQQQAAEEKLTKEIAELNDQLAVQTKKEKQLQSARVRSLPANEELARRAYPMALGQLAEAAGVPKPYSVLPKNADGASRNVPEVSKGKPVYTRIAYDVTFKHADMAMIKEFLEGYYRLGLLQQITSLHIKKEEDPIGKNAGKRNDLTVTLTTEAILIDGAENRRTLVPIPTAFAAAGGAAIFNGMSNYKGHDAKGLEFGLGVTPVVTVPVLSPNPRDYSLIVRKDPFNGPLPVVPPAPFEVARISDVKVRPNERPDPVKVSVSGEGSTGATVVALAAGDLFAEGALKVDPATRAIELPETSAYEGTSTITVIATSTDGKESKKSFKVSVAEPKAPTGEDISAFVVLIGVTRSDDGKAWARILDNANRMRYQIDASRSGIKVAKEEIFIPRRGWQATADSKGLAPGVMVISAPGCATHRTFKVIAVDTDGLIVADMQAPPKDTRGGRPAGKPHANPMAALGGNMIVGPPALKYYRWGVGQSLATIKLLKDEEAKKVLQHAEAAGPVMDVAAVER
ncbi:hypothetical protein [Frigoriglobus tundricola]|uniref:Uncharacterized protein n=1 Tax=Frigoriglobus tundricola TaxID=2774151 RepID=A0A6M5YT01_9BACT|nr:hypothetical protein [Frigoriglobus tundricola]QJW97185.1 hypothetical protein FTUN_4750 [Frigoriglobus tundricola]